MNYVLYGEESYRLKKTLKTIISKYIQDESDLNLVTYDAATSDMEVILEDAMTIPFFQDYKVIVVYHANFLSTNNDTGIDPNVLSDYVDHPMDSTVLILVGDFQKLDSRKKIVKRIKESWKVLEFKKLDELAKQTYVREELKNRKISINDAGFQELLRRSPLDMESIQRELEKLELYGEDITYDVITHLVTRPLEDNVFDLVHAVVEKDKRKAFQIYRDLCVVNTDAIYLIALLSSQFRFLFQVKTLMNQGRSKEDIVTELHAHPYRVKLAMNDVSRLSNSYLMQMLAKLATLDQQLKAGLIDKKMGFELFLIEL